MSNARDKANIPVLNFQSKGIDDNATSTALTINSNETVEITSSEQELLYLNSSHATNCKIKLQGGYHSNLFSQITESAGAFVMDVDPNGQEAGSNFRVKIGGSEKARLNSTGLGIGTSSPGAGLEVSNSNGIKISRSGYSQYMQLYPANNNVPTILGLGGNGIHIGTTTSTGIHVDGSDNVGIGETAPQGKLHVRTADSGATVNSDADELIVENGTSGAAGGISILSATNGYGNLFFGDSGDSNVGLVQYDHSNNAMRFFANASERMRIDSSGNVGIGTSAPDGQLHIVGSDTTDQVIIENTDGGASSAPDLVLFRNSSSPADNDVLGRIDFRGDNDAGQSVNYMLMYATATDVSDGTEDVKLDFEGMKAGSNAKLLTLSEAEAVFNEDSNDVDFRVESNNDTHTLFVNSGNDAVIFGDGSNLTPAESSTATHACIPNNGRMSISASSYPCLVTNRVNSEGITIQFRQAGGVRGSISVGGASTSYNTSSDYRLKENVSYEFDATTKLKQLKPARFNWLSDETKTLVDGFIAHEVSDIIPEAVIGTKDAVDENGNIEPQGIDQSKLVPLLVKTIQELEARITTLEANNP